MKSHASALKPYLLPRSYRFNSAEILRSLSQQHETFLKDGEEVRRVDPCRKCELTGAGPSDREPETCDSTAHSIFGGSRDLQWSGGRAARRPATTFRLHSHAFCGLSYNCNRLYSRDETLDGSLLNPTPRRAHPAPTTENSCRASVDSLLLRRFSPTHAPALGATLVRQHNRI